MQIKPVGRSRFDYAIIGLLVVAVGWLIFRTEFDTAEPDTPAMPVADLSAEPQVLHNSIAVLPFENLSPNPNDAYFAAGMHEESRRAKLQKIAELGVDPWGGRFDGHTPIGEIRAREGEIVTDPLPPDATERQQPQQHGAGCSRSFIPGNGCGETRKRMRL